jgi:protein-tyrosine-phosphatase
VLVTESSPVQAAFTLLLIGTGNICRSAMAERLGRAFVDQVMGEHADEVRIDSAGTRAVVGSAMHPDSALVLRGFGAQPGDFRARQLVNGTVSTADLTLTMTRAHRNEVLRRRDKPAAARTFTLLEAVKLLEQLRNAPRDGATFAERAQNLVRGLATARSGRRVDVDDDIRDLVGQPLDVHDGVGTVVVEALLPVLKRIAELRQ